LSIHMMVVVARVAVIVSMVVRPVASLVLIVVRISPHNLLVRVMITLNAFTLKREVVLLSITEVKVSTEVHIRGRETSSAHSVALSVSTLCPSVPSLIVKTWLPAAVHLASILVHLHNPAVHAPVIPLTVGTPWLILELIIVTTAAHPRHIVTAADIFATREVAIV
jgi:hypothetical protein